MENVRLVDTITPQIAGKVLHKNAEFIRAGLRQNKFPFGTAVQSDTGQWNYLIITSKFVEYSGIERSDLDEIIKITKENSN